MLKCGPDGDDNYVLNEEGVPVLYGDEIKEDGKYIYGPYSPKSDATIYTANINGYTVRSCGGGNTWKGFLEYIMWEDKDNWDDTTYEVLLTLNSLALDADRFSEEPVHWWASFSYVSLLNPDDTQCHFNEIVDSTLQYKYSTSNFPF